MCGIVGFINHKDDNLLKEMNFSLYHRGPDEEGFFIKEKLSMAIRRLKIIDLNTGSQPIYNEDKTIVVVFNGEIYNFQELKEDLIKKGHRFYTKTDTEVLVHLYEEYDLDFFSKLRGMFAFSLWDEKKQSLILARDHFGIKPLYYTVFNNKLFFSSEIKALKKIKTNFSINLSALGFYFKHMYIPSNLTIYKEIKKLPPAHFLIYKNDEIKIKKYWNFKKEKVKTLNKDFFHQVEYILKDSIREQNVSDVPLGLFLSGGIDSNSLLYFLNQVNKKPINTFTISYENEKSYDESVLAEMSSKYFKTKHHNIYVKPNIENLILEFSSKLDQPFADSSALINYLISKEAKKYITVGLSGLGGDEVFAGYPRYQAFLLLKKYLKLPFFIRKNLNKTFLNFKEDDSSTNNIGRIKRFLNSTSLTNNIGLNYYNWISYYNDEELFKIFNLKDIKINNIDNLNENNLMEFEFENYLEGDLLYLSDLTSMANSLELRVPFLDIRLVELMNSLPLSLKMKAFQKKYILKKILQNKIPKSILTSPKKGFQIPISKFFRNELKDFILDVLNSSNNDFYNKKEVLNLFEDHLKMKKNNIDKIYSIIIFNLWSKNAFK